MTNTATKTPRPLHPRDEATIALALLQHEAIAIYLQALRDEAAADNAKR